jgi:hypothetical protein
MVIVNKYAPKRGTLRLNFILLLPVLLILATSWKKESIAKPPATAKIVKYDSVIYLAVLKTNMNNTTRLVNTKPTEITAREGKLHVKAQLQTYIDSLIISPAATIGLKRDGKAVNENNTINGQSKKNSTLNKVINDNRFVIDNTTKLRKVLPPDIPSDPDF